MRVSEWHLVGSYQFCTNHAVFEFPELAPVHAGIEPSSVDREQHLYAVAKLIGDKRRVHACHEAHGSVGMASVALSARHDPDFPTVSPGPNHPCKGKQQPSSTVFSGFGNNLFTFVARGIRQRCHSFDVQLDRHLQQGLQLHQKSTKGWGYLLCIGPRIHEYEIGEGGALYQPK